MRGQPRWRFLLVVAVFAVLAVPLWRLTRAADDAVAPVPVAAADARPAAAAAVALRVEVAFTAPPAEFSLDHLGHALLTGNGGLGQTFAGGWTVALPKEGADLVLRARWPERAGIAAVAGPVAVRVVVSGFPGGETFERTFWTAPGAASLAEVVTVSVDGGAKP